MICDARNDKVPIEKTVNRSKTYQNNKVALEGELQLKGLPNRSIFHISHLRLDDLLLR